MWFDIEEVHSDSTDGVLCCSFDLEIIEEIERKQTDIYGRIENNIILKGVCIMAVKNAFNRSNI